MEIRWNWFSCISNHNAQMVFFWFCSIAQKNEIESYSSAGREDTLQLWLLQRRLVLMLFEGTQSIALAALLFIWWQTLNWCTHKRISWLKMLSPECVLIKQIKVSSQPVRTLLKTTLNPLSGLDNKVWCENSLHFKLEMSSLKRREDSLMTGCLILDIKSI